VSARGGCEDRLFFVVGLAFINIFWMGEQIGTKGLMIGLMLFKPVFCCGRAWNKLSGRKYFLGISWPSW